MGRRHHALAVFAMRMRQRVPQLVDRFFHQTLPQDHRIRRQAMELLAQPATVSRRRAFSCSEREHYKGRTIRRKIPRER